MLMPTHVHQLLLLQAHEAGAVRVVHLVDTADRVVGSDGRAPAAEARVHYRNLSSAPRAAAVPVRLSGESPTHPACPADAGGADCVRGSSGVGFARDDPYEKNCTFGMRSNCDLY